MGYFEYLRTYKHLDREEPHIRSAAHMWRLMAVPVIGGIALYICLDYLSVQLKWGGDTSLASRLLIGALACSTFLIFMPLANASILFRSRVSKELVPRDDAQMIEMRRQFIYSHTPWCANWYLFLIPFYVYFSSMVCCTTCTWFFRWRLPLNVLIIAMLIPLGANYTMLKKMRRQIPDVIKTHSSKIALDVFQETNGNSFHLKLTAGSLWFLSLFFLAIPTLIFLSPSKESEPAPSFGFWCGVQLVFTMLALGVFFFGRYVWKIANRTQTALTEIRRLEGQALLDKLRKLNDCDLVTIYEPVVLNGDGALLDSVATEMKQRNLLAPDKVLDPQGIYILKDGFVLPGGGNVLVSELFTLTSAPNNYSSPLLIRNNQFLSATIKEVSFIVTETILEIYFQRKTFKDKITLKTDRLNEWLDLFSRWNIPVEDKRRKR